MVSLGWGTGDCGASITSIAAPWNTTSFKPGLHSRINPGSPVKVSWVYYTLIYGNICC